MKGLILAGGAGTRLRPITHTSAKQLVPIANKPILFYVVEQMADAGIKEVGVIVGDTASEIEAVLGDGSAFGLKITYIPQDEPLGLAHCVLIAREFLGDDDFVMYLGDNMLQLRLKEIVDRFEQRRNEQPTLQDDTARIPSAQILLAHVDDPTQFGVAELDGYGNVRNLVEKPSDPPSDLALTGVYIFDVTVHEAVARSRRRHAVSSRSPTRSSGCSTTVTPSRTRSSTDGGSTPGRRIRCSTATGWSSTRSRAESTVRSTSSRASKAGL